jgi:hypothetical protein
MWMGVWLRRLGLWVVEVGWELGVVSCYKFWHGKIRGDNRVLRGGGRMVYIMN